MKICCSQEHYDKVVQYAKSINDKTLENCLERLKQWEKNENRPCEIELYYDHATYSFGFCERYPDGNTGIVGGLLYHGNPDESFAVTMERFHGCRRTAVSWKSGRVLCRHHGTFPRMEHTYLTYMRQSVLGSLMQYGVPFFMPETSLNRFINY